MDNSKTRQILSTRTKTNKTKNTTHKAKKKLATQTS